MSEIIARKSGAHYATDFLSWTDGVDALLKPSDDAPLPHVLVHVARVTNTPWGIAPAGMLLINPDMKEVPDFFGFVCADEELGKYFENPADLLQRTRYRLLTKEIRQGGGPIEVEFTE